MALLAILALPVAMSALLSEEPRVELRGNFLASEELKALRILAEQEMFQDLSDPEGGSTNSPHVCGGEELSILNTSDPDIDSEDTESEWELLQSLLARSARALDPDAALNSAEASASVAFVAKWAPWRPNSALNRSGPLHLDARLQPKRRKTALMFLSGAGRDEDGATVFPCIETDDLDPKEAQRRRKLCSRAARHMQAAHEKLLAVRQRGLDLDPSKQYEFLEQHPELAGLAPEVEGVRPVNWLWLPGYDAVAEAAPLPLAADPLHLLAEKMCRNLAPGLRVRSKAGDALFMDILEPDSFKADWRLWHAGCSPLKGPRLTAQVFLSRSACDSHGGCGTRSAKS